jgi:hypothetical protein
MQESDCEHVISTGWGGEHSVRVSPERKLRSGRDRVREINGGFNTTQGRIRAVSIGDDTKVSPNVEAEARFLRTRRYNPKYNATCNTLITALILVTSLQYHSLCSVTLVCLLWWYMSSYLRPMFLTTDCPWM